MILGSGRLHHEVKTFAKFHVRKYAKKEALFFFLASLRRHKILRARAFLKISLCAVKNYRSHLNISLEILLFYLIIKTAFHAK